MVEGCSDGGVVITEQSMLVETISRQRKVLGDLERRVGDTEREMDERESNIHRLRRETNGENYLQDAYLIDGGELPGERGKNEVGADMGMVKVW